MADQETQAEDRTEDATPERRDEFREKGQVVISRELTSVLVLAAIIVFISAWARSLVTRVERLFVTHFEALATRRIDQDSVIPFALDIWSEGLWLVLPIFVVTSVIAIATTFGQSRLNWSWQRVSPDWSRLNPLSGLARMVNLQAAMELGKSIAKMVAVATVTYLVLMGEWERLPPLMNWSIPATWSYWGQITKDLFWAVAGLLLLIAAVDYLYNFISHERQVKMTKQEVKEEYKRREVDPHVKGRMRRMQREALTRNKVAKTRKATAVITNPTHFSVAIKYELGDGAPVVLAKGEDDVALRMREVAREEKIPIIENKPLARALYAQVEEGEEIPSKFYAAVAEIIKYVFRLKGKRLPGRSRATPKPPPRTEGPGLT